MELVKTQNFNKKINLKYNFLVGQINMLVGHIITFRGPYVIKNKNMIEGRRFTLRGPQLARGPRVADPSFIRKFLCFNLVIK